MKQDLLSLVRGDIQCAHVVSLTRSPFDCGPTRRPIKPSWFSTSNHHDQLLIATVDLLDIGDVCGCLSIWPRNFGYICQHSYYLFREVFVADSYV